VDREKKADAGGYSSPCPLDTAEVGAAAELGAAEEDTVHCIADTTVARSDGAMITEVAATSPGTAVGAERVSGQSGRSSTSNFAKRMKTKPRERRPTTVHGLPYMYTYRSSDHRSRVKSNFAEVKEK